MGLVVLAIDAVMRVRFSPTGELVGASICYCISLV
jgi:hypothetical protein